MAPTLRNLTVGLILALVTVGAARVTLVHRDDLSHVALDAAEPLLVLPKPFAFGQETTLADLYWVHLVSYVGHPHAIRNDWPRLSQLLERVVTMDPDFRYAYQAGGLLLTSGGHHDEADDVLVRGMERFPDQWVFPFYAGFNAWQGLGQLDRAARLFFQGAQISGSPRMLSVVSTRLLATTDRLEQALLLVEAALSQPQPPLLYERLVEERTALYIERDLRYLEVSAQAFADRTGRMPMDLEELTSDSLKLEKLVARIQAQYDAGMGTFRSPFLPTRLSLPSEVVSPDRTIPPAGDLP